MYAIRSYYVMVMRHCVLSGALGESACGLCKMKRFELEDMKGSRFLVVTDAHCQSHIYQGSVTQRNARDDLALGVRHFRVELVITSYSIHYTKLYEVPVRITIESFKASTGGDLLFQDVLPDSMDWNSLNRQDTKSYIALGLQYVVV